MTIFDTYICVIFTQHECLFFSPNINNNDNINDNVVIKRDNDSSNIILRFYTLLYIEILEN